MAEKGVWVEEAATIAQTEPAASAGDILGKKSGGFADHHQKVILLP